MGIEAKYIDPEKWDTDGGIASLKKRFGIRKELIQTYFHSYVYLNDDAMREHGLNTTEVECAVAAAESSMNACNF